MAQTNVNIRIDEDLKKDAEALFAELGLNMTSAVNIFIRQSLREKGIPFEITLRPEKNEEDFYNPVNLKRLALSIDQVKNNQVVTKSFEDLARMAADE